MAENIKTVPRMLHHWATHQPDTAAFVFVDSTMKRRVLTRADFYRLAARYAAILRRGNIRHGDVVSNTLPNSPERVVTDYGIMLAGATAMNGQIFLSDGEDFVGSLRGSSCQAIILDPLELKGAMPILESLGKEELGDGRVRVQGLPALRMLFPCHWKRQGKKSSLMEILEEQQESYVADVTADNLACLWTTSGSTGFSKLVPHTHSRLLRYALVTSEDRGLFPVHECSSDNTEAQNGDGATHNTVSGDRATHYARYVVFNNNPLGWSGGFPAQVLALGATRVLIDQSRGPPCDIAALSWAVIRQERCQYAIFLPFYGQQLLSREELWKNSPWKFKVVCLTGQPVHSHLVQDAIRKVTDSVNVLYGSTEDGPLTSKTVSDPSGYEDCDNGKPFPGVEVRVVDEELKDVSSAHGKTGEIICRSDISSLGYFNNEEATQKKLLPDSWIRTGDIGYFNEKGDLFVICRTSFVIMRGAYNVNPGWLEARISNHPAVENVLVVPVPDPVLHQELCACLKMKPGTDVTKKELQEFCQSLFLTDSCNHMTAVPRYFLFFSALPTNVTGKLCRHTAAREALARLGL